jgi:Chalcone isomerase-like
MRIGVFLLGALLAFPAASKEREGVTAPPTVEVGGRRLHLMGMGLRKKLWFKVYLASFYLERPTEDGAQAISSDQVKQVRMHMLRDLERDKIVEAVQEGFQKNSGPDMPRLQARLHSFLEAIPDLKRGQQILITYLPGTGTLLRAGRGEEITIPGKDFADALFSVWLGKQPVDDDLKGEMLRNR